MKVSNLVRNYIEMALREKIALECPGYGKIATERVVAASMDGLKVSQATLYRAIELAAFRIPDDSIAKETQWLDG